LEGSFRSATWFDWAAQVRSTERLARERLAWVLPGHGRRARVPAEEMPAALRRCIEWMQART
jgi:glyoxylase-like metal-dependent hydrolase (beta-lactamase superfamily II)